MSEYAGLFVIFGGMLLFTAIVVGYDLLARRQQRRDRERHHSA